MIRALSLAAALAVLPINAALAADQPATTSSPDTEAAEAAIEAAGAAFEARMEAFGARAEAIASNEDQTEAQREARIAALWTEYQPEVAVFTAAVSRHAGAIANAALAEIDMDALVGEALSDPEVVNAMAEAGQAAAGMARNGAWAQPDPEQMVTYGLMAQYGLDQAMDHIAPAPVAEDLPAAPPAPPATR